MNYNIIYLTETESSNLNVSYSKRNSDSFFHKRKSCTELALIECAGAYVRIFGTI
jgi:hypothetical protein